MWKTKFQLIPLKFRIPEPCIEGCSLTLKDASIIIARLFRKIERFFSRVERYRIKLPLKSCGRPCPSSAHLSAGEGTHRRQEPVGHAAWPFCFHPAIILIFHRCHSCLNHLHQYVHQWELSGYFPSVYSFICICGWSAGHGEGGGRRM